MNEKSLFERAWRIYELDEADAGDLNAWEWGVVFVLAALGVAGVATVLTVLFLLAHALLAWIFGI